MACSYQSQPPRPATFNLSNYWLCSRHSLPSTAFGLQPSGQAAFILPIYCPCSLHSSHLLPLKPSFFPFIAPAAFIRPIFCPCSLHSSHLLPLQPSFFPFIAPAAFIHPIYCPCSLQFPTPDPATFFFPFNWLSFPPAFWPSRLNSSHLLALQPSFPPAF
jgi:hypothetical protein